MFGPSEANIPQNISNSKYQDLVEYHQVYTKYLNILQTTFSI